MRRPSLIIICCLGFMAGLLLGYNFIFQPNGFWLLFVAISTAASFVISKKLKFVPLLLVCVVCGLSYTTSYINTQAEQSASRDIYRKTVVVGTVRGDPYWDKDRNYVFSLADVAIDGQAKSSEIRIKTFSSAVKEGHRVRVEGKIFPILAKPKYQISYGTVEIINFDQPLIIKIKQAFYGGADKALSPDAAAFMKGILVGARTSLAQPLQDTLNAVGLSHIVAVSGYNLTILVVLLARLLKKRWLWGSLVVSLLLVWCFTLLTGMSASILRAAIMATVFLVAGYYGKKVSVLVCIGLTAVATLLVNPTLAIEDIGWQLSFLSLTGIVVLSPIIRLILPKKTKIVSELLAITLAAQIATIPYLLYLFGGYSVVAVVANVALMPLIPLLMLVGFWLSIVGIVLPNHAYLLGGPVNKGVELIFGFLGYLKAQSNFQMAIHPDIASLAFWYSCLMILALITYNKNRDSELLPFQKPEQLVR